MTPSVWTNDRVVRLTKLWAAGQTAREIAADLGGGISRNAVIGKAHRIPLPRHPSLPPVEPTPECRRSATIAIENLTAQSCRYPIGDPRKPGFRFCGRRRMAGSSFCAEHHAVVWKRAG